MCWILMIHAIAHSIIENDASDDERAALLPGYDSLMDELGIGSPQAWQARIPLLHSFAHDLYDSTEKAIHENPDVRD